jgi:hypothetical protein
MPPKPATVPTTQPITPPLRPSDLAAAAGCAAAQFTDGFQPAS